MKRLSSGGALAALFVLAGCSSEGAGVEALGVARRPLLGYSQTIKYPAGASADVVALANELDTLLEQITGATFSVGPMAAGDPGTSGIYLTSPTNWGSAVPANMAAHAGELAAGTRG